MPTIVGIDLALVNTGIVTLVTNRDGEFVCVATELIKTAKASKKQNLYAAVDDVQRAARLYNGIMAELRASRPALVVVELPSGSQSAVSAQCNGLAKGVIASIREALPEVPFVWLHENQIKQALAGKHKTSKDEIAAAVLERLPDMQEYLDKIAKTKREHLTDAAAAVLAAEGCEIWRAALRTEVTIEWGEEMPMTNNTSEQCRP